MAIPTGIDNTIRTPLFYSMIDNSKAGYKAQKNASLLVGYATNDVELYEPFLITKLDQARDKFGTNAMITEMFDVYLENDPEGEVYGMVVPEPIGTKATGSIEITGTATSSGLVNLYVTDKKVTALVNAGDTEADITPRIIAAINQEIDLPVVVKSSESGVITFEALHTGAAGNDIYLELNYFGNDNPDEKTPAGLNITVSQFDGGTGTPDLDQLFAATNDDSYYITAHPFNDISSLIAFRDEYNLKDGRWGPMLRNYGFHVTARRGDIGLLQSYGNNNANDPTGSSFGFEEKSLTPCWKVAAMIAAQARRELSEDPARPLQTLVLKGFMPPKNRKDWLKRKERNILLWSGVATIKHTKTRETQIEAMISMYRVNKYGLRDPSYLYINTLANLAYQLTELERTITQEYPRHKLANDGTNFDEEQPIVTPSMIKNTLIAKLEEFERDGLVENIALVKKHMIVERDPNNPERANVLYPPDLVNALRVLALLAQFRNQY